MELTIWKGDYGLVSMCPSCIRLVLFTKLLKAPVKITAKSNPVGNPIGNYPVFRHNDLTVTDYEDCVSYLRINRYSLDFGLTRKDCSLAYALTWLVMDKLTPALEYTLWLDPKNYSEFTFPWFKAVMPPVFNQWFCYKRRKHAQVYLETLFPEITSKEFLHKYLLESANECLSILSTRLGKSDYFFGCTPTSIDSTVFAYLAPLLKIPLPSNEFGCLLKSYPTLCEFVKRIDNQYFADVPKETQFIKTDNDVFQAKSFGDTKEEDGALSTKSKLLVGAIVTSAMLTYAVSLNIIDLSKFVRSSAV